MSDVSNTTSGFSHLKKGDVHQSLNKTIEELVYCNETYLVYIDTDYAVQWETADEHTSPDYCGEALNHVSRLEGQSNFLEGASLRVIRLRIAEGLARCFDPKNSRDASIAALNEVEAEIRARNRETSWKWYFTTSYYLALGIALGSGLLWICRDAFRVWLGATGYEVLLGMLFGAFGALLSATARGDRLAMDANAGKALHQLEGLSRVGAGMVGALLTGLALKGGLLLGGVRFEGNSLAVLLTLCIVAGASERLVPSLIESLSSKDSLPLSG